MKGLNLGTGLFSEASKAAALSSYKIQHIPFEKIRPNDEAHGFSLDGIEELAESIADVGLEQNLVVEDAGDGNYNILTGRRRYYAIKLLRDNGSLAWKTVPCVVKNLAEMDLPLTEETKRTYAIVTTNAEQRKLTPADTAEMVKKLTKVYDELEANGAKPKGRRREFIAKILGLSTGTVSSYEYVEHNADESVREALEEGTIGIHEAVKEVKEKERAKIGTETEANESTARHTLRRDAVFVLPYNDFSEEYTLDGETYRKAMDIIYDIRRRYQKLSKLLKSR